MGCHVPGCRSQAGDRVHHCFSTPAVKLCTYYHASFMLLTCTSLLISISTSKKRQMIPSTSGFVHTLSTAGQYFPAGFDIQITKITVPFYPSCAKIRRERPHLASTSTDLSHSHTSTRQPPDAFTSRSSRCPLMAPIVEMKCCPPTA
jgi:hypothetical protein